MRIQSVQNDDLLQLSRIEKELFEEDAFGVFLLLYYLQEHLFFEKIIEEPDEIIGFGIISDFDTAVLNPHEIHYIQDLQKEKRSIAHLVDFAIRKKYWNQGHGTFLLRHLVSKLVEKEYDFLYLEVDSSNVRALQFYKKNEFKEIGNIQFYYNSGHDATLMVRRLERFS